jgi:hypothetical protein
MMMVPRVFRLSIGSLSTSHDTDCTTKRRPSPFAMQGLRDTTSNVGVGRQDLF